MEAKQQFKEKTLYRTSQRNLNDIEDSLPRLPKSAQLNRPNIHRSHGSAHQLNRPGSSVQTAHQKSRNHKLNHSQEKIDWNDLGEKIDDWFDCAKTPDQRVVYRFLSNLNDQDTASVISECNSAQSVSTNDKVQSLEDILANLKKYRHKFNRAQTTKSARQTTRPNTQNENLPSLEKSHKDLNTMFESSTWRVMRHLKSADIRNKYPLPKANPDYHFRNATIFHVAGRPPKSTFLLHPDWV